MADTNRVEFGLEKVTIGTYEVGADGAITMGAPYKLAGAVSLSADPQTSENTFSADNGTYWAEYSESGFKGTLTMARFPDEFKTKFLGAVKRTDGGIATINNPVKKNVYIAFEGKGDAHARRTIFYNVALGTIKKEYKTMEKNSKTPETESIDITVVGDSATGQSKVTFVPGDAAYNNFFTAPPKPLGTTAPGV